MSPPSSPDVPGPYSSKPWETVVRIKILHEKSTRFGSGTIIRSTPAESLILTSAHQFRPDPQVPLGELTDKIKVDLFDGYLHGMQAGQVHYLETVDGEFVDCDFQRDVGLVRIRPGRRLPTSKVVPRRWEPRIRMKMLTLGCSEGNDATAWMTSITNPRVRGLAGNPEYEAIECQTAPKQGRTGGGLFTGDGYLAGICNFAEPEGNHGLYATPDSIYRLLDRNGLSFLYAAPVVAEKEIDDLIRAAEGQLKKDEWEGADRTIQHLNALIEERREGLQDALRSLDANYSRRRDELLRRASERRPETHKDPIPEGDIPDPGLEMAPDAPARPEADARLGRILEEWRRRSAAYTSLDVRFTGLERNPRWGEENPLTGRIVLASGGRAFVEVARGAEKARFTERTIWMDDTMHLFLPERREHFIWPLDAKDRGRLPAFLALPFFWNLSAEGLKSRYDIELFMETPEAWYLRVRPRTRVGRESFSKAFIILDRSTYLPLRYFLTCPDGKSSKDFRITETRCNQPISDEVWRIPDDSGWKVSRRGGSKDFFLQRYKLDLLP